MKTTFQRTFAHEIAAGCAAIGKPAPDFGALSRKGALDAIDALVASASTDPAFLKLKPLLIALRDLDPKVIDTSWCVH